MAGFGQKENSAQLGEEAVGKTRQSNYIFRVSRSCTGTGNLFKFPGASCMECLCGQSRCVRSGGEGMIQSIGSERDSGPVLDEYR